MLVCGIGGTVAQRTIIDVNKKFKLKLNFSKEILKIYKNIFYN